MTRDNPHQSQREARETQVWSPLFIAVTSLLLNFPAGLALALVNWQRMALTERIREFGIGGAAFTLVWLVVQNLPSNPSLYNVSSSTTASRFLINFLLSCVLYSTMKSDQKALAEKQNDLQSASWALGLLIALGTWAALTGAVVLMRFITRSLT
jgi:hypothetical protein